MGLEPWIEPTALHGGTTTYQGPFKANILRNMHKSTKNKFIFLGSVIFPDLFRKKRCPELGSYKLFTSMNVHLCLFMSRDGQDDSPNMQEQEEK